MLSPLDQLMPKIYSTVFLVYETDEFENAIAKLNEGLAKATSVLPYLRGSVHKSSEDGHPRNQLSLSWSPLDPPPLVVETAAIEPLPSFATLKLSGAPLSVFQGGLAPASTLINYDEPGTKAPVLVVGATRLEGGLILCLCAHHVVMDGTGMAMFLKLWGDCIRNDRNISDDKALDAAELHHREAWLRDGSGYFETAGSAATLDELLLRHPEYNIRSVSPAVPFVSTIAPGQPLECAAKIFTFSASKLQEAKQAMSGSVSAKLLTVNNILGAALWLSITRVRLARMHRDGLPAVADSTTSRLGFAVNARSRLGPAVSNKSFLGNVTMLKVAEFPATKLASITANADLALMAPIISTITAGASTVTAAYVGEVMELADHLADFGDVGPGWNATHGLDLTYTSWANLGMYDCDFGPVLGGQPRFVRIPYMPFLDGMVLALPRHRPVDSLDGKTVEKIEVTVMMNERDMRAIEEDELLRSWSI